MRLVDDDSVVSVQQRIGLGLGQQNAVGHEFDRRIPTQTVMKPHLEADYLPQRRFKLLCDTLGDAGCSDASGLGMANQLTALPCRVVQLAASHRQQNFW